MRAQWISDQAVKAATNLIDAPSMAARAEALYGDQVTRA